MKKIYSTYFLSLLLSILAFIQSNTEAYATHAQGADLTYSCLGNNQYEVRLSFYRDCSGVAAPNTIAVDLGSNSCNAQQQLTLNRIANTGQEVTPICPTMNSTCTGGGYPGVQEYIYSTVITLPFACTDWTLSFSVCCRNNAISTIQNPGGQPIYLEALINNFDYPCNSSPQFSNPPVPFVCVGQTYCFNHGATDIDGDSLAYSLVQPMTGPNTTVTYLNGYSAGQPLLSNPAITVDPLTGDICMTPTIQEVTVLAILVEEYRNGVLIGQVTRDIQIRTINCTNNNPTLSGIDGTNSYTTVACAGNTVSFSIFSSDPDAGQNLSVSWNGGIPNASLSLNNNPHPTATFTWTPTAQQISNTPYCFTVTVADDNCPMNGTQTFAYCITVTGFDASISTTNANCGASNGTASASVNGGQAPYTYSWSYSGNASNNQVNTGLPAGQYQVDITDQSGCNITIPFAITGTTAPGNIGISSSDVACFGAATGSATANANGGQQPYTYQWSNGGTTQTAQNLVAGWHYVTITTADGCSTSDSVFIDQPGQPLTGTVMSLSHPTCFGAGNGSIEVSASGGTLPYTYTWSTGQTGGLLSNVSGGNYQVEIVDANGCVSQVGASLTDPFPLTIDVSAAEDVSCFGYNDGSAMVSASGGTGVIGYSWNTNPVQNGSGATNLPAGSYTATATDANGCVSSITIQIAEPAPLSASLNLTHITCHGAADGEISVTAAGGTAPYQYTWQGLPGINGPTATGLGSGVYQVTITDINDCSLILQDTLHQPDPLILTTNGSDTICPGEFITLHASAAGGTGTIAYNWSTNQTADSISVSPSGYTIYTVQATDANGCHSQNTAIPVWVSNINQVSISMVGGQAVCPGELSTVGATITGGIGTYFLNWDNNLGMGEGPFDVSPWQSTWYTVTVIDECMNTISDSIEVVVHDLPDAELLADNGSGCGAVSFGFQNNYATIPGTSYFWDFGDGQYSAAEFPMHTYTQSGDYLVTLTVISPQGCENSSSAYYEVNVFPVAQAEFESPIEVSEFDAHVQFTNTSLFASSFEWDFGDGTSSTAQHPEHTYSEGGEYVVTLISTNMHGCADTAYEVILVQPEFTFYVPNAFTPDGDGTNDYFKGVGNHVQELEMMVFDRWGELIYQSNALDASWDGTFRGMPSKSDVYVYKFKVRDIHGGWHDFQGHITLLK